MWSEREQGYRAGLAMGGLPDDLNRAFKTGQLATALGFGTADPPKPIERLREVASAVKAQQQHSGAVPPACSDEDLSALWREICAHSKQAKLSPAEQRELRSLAHSLPLLPGISTSPGSRVQSSRCVSSPKISAGAEGTDSLSSGPAVRDRSVDSVLVGAMTVVGWLVDVSSSSYPLVSVQETLCALLGIGAMASVSELGPFSAFVCETEPVMTDALRDGLTVATHRLLRQKHRFGSQMKCYCTAGPQTLSSGWRLMSGKDAGGVRPVVNDDAEKASMLTKEHGFQFAGIYNHERDATEPAQAVGNVLAAMDRDIQTTLHLPRLSSPEFSVRIQTRGSGEELSDARIRFKYVLKLLTDWCTANHLPVPSATQFSCTKVSRFTQIVKTFTVPSATPIKSSVWACWRPGGVVLLCADSEDYVAELQGEVFARMALGNQLAKSGARLAHQMHPTKHLNLLCHIESHRRFEKFLRRDHGEWMQQSTHSLRAVVLWRRRETYCVLRCRCAQGSRRGMCQNYSRHCHPFQSPCRMSRSLRWHPQLQQPLPRSLALAECRALAEAEAPS